MRGKFAAFVILPMSLVVLALTIMVSLEVKKMRGGIDHMQVCLYSIECHLMNTIDSLEGLDVEAFGQISCDEMFPCGDYTE